MAQSNQHFCVGQGCPRWGTTNEVITLARRKVVYNMRQIKYSMSHAHINLLALYDDDDYSATHAAFSILCDLPCAVGSLRIGSLHLPPHHCHSCSDVCFPLCTSPFLSAAAGRGVHLLLLLPDTRKSSTGSMSKSNWCSSDGEERMRGRKGWQNEGEREEERRGEERAESREQSLCRELPWRTDVLCREAAERACFRTALLERLRDHSRSATQSLAMFNGIGCWAGDRFH